MKFPLMVVNDHGTENGWYIIDADGKRVSRCTVCDLIEDERLCAMVNVMNADGRLKRRLEPLTILDQQEAMRTRLKWVFAENPDLTADQVALLISTIERICALLCVQTHESP